MNEEDKDRFALILSGPLILTLILGGGTAWIQAKGVQATGWLMERNILVSKDQAMIPILDAGLDGPRIAVIIAVVALILTFSIMMVRRTLRIRRAIRYSQR